MYVLAALILIAVVLTTTLASRFSLPLIVIALGVGIVFGSDVTGLIWFDDVEPNRRGIAPFSPNHAIFQKLCDITRSALTGSGSCYPPRNDGVNDQLRPFRGFHRWGIYCFRLYGPVEFEVCENREISRYFP